VVYILTFRSILDGRDSSRSLYITGWMGVDIDAVWWVVYILTSGAFLRRNSSHSLHITIITFLLTNKQNPKLKHPQQNLPLHFPSRDTNPPHLLKGIGPRVANPLRSINMSPHQKHIKNYQPHTEVKQHPHPHVKMTRPRRTRPRTQLNDVIYADGRTRWVERGECPRKVDCDKRGRGFCRGDRHCERKCDGGDNGDDEGPRRRLSRETRLD
jgi:hypothetical protein